MYCACQAKGSRGPAAATAPQLRQEALCTARATQKRSAEAEVRTLTAPARQKKAAAGQRQPPRRSSSRKLCTAPATHEGSKEALCTAPATRKAAAAQLLLEALCTARATRKAARKLSVQ